jgi:hypothetical protein
MATFEERGVLLAALRQPDGRLSGRRDHDARLPVQVAAVGQPARGGHDLHAVRERLQHDGVDQGQAEWAKGARLIRTTPRYNADVNSYWMCDIGRFDYHWIEATGAAAAARPSGRARDAVSWADALVAVNERRRGRGRAAHAQFLVSAHASLEELFVLREMPARPAASRCRGGTRKAAAGKHQVQDSGRRRARTCTARRTWDLRSANPSGRPTCPRSSPQSKPDA